MAPQWGWRVQVAPAALKIPATRTGAPFLCTNAEEKNHQNCGERAEEEKPTPPSPRVIEYHYLWYLPPISMHPLNTCVHPLLKAVIFVLKPS